MPASADFTLEKPAEPNKPVAAQGDALPLGSGSQNDEQRQQQIREAVERLREYASSMDRTLEFRIDDESGYTVIEVKDPETGDVLRQIPGDDVLERARNNPDSLNLFDEKA
ncbi:MAG: flagellar protein FlaG [Pseudomonadota bacterium]